MAYLHCPACERTASLDSTSESPLLCLHCGAALTPMSVRRVRQLVGAIRERFERDGRLDAERPRFVR